MIRALTILAAVAALAVSAAPVASAGVVASVGWPDGISANGDLRTGLTAKGRGAGKVANHSEGTVRGIIGGRYGDGKFGGR